MSFCADKNKLVPPSAGGKSEIVGVNDGFGKSVRSADSPELRDGEIGADDLKKAAPLPVMSSDRPI